MSTEQATTLGAQTPHLLQPCQSAPSLSPDDGGSRYLQVPVDDCRHLSSPPCSPVPPNWSELVESPPVPWIEDFDLEAESGLVHLGNGQWVDLSSQAGSVGPDTDSGGDKRGFVVRRRGMVLSRKTAAARLGDMKRLCFGKDGDTSLLTLADDTILPPIVVDAYE